MKRKTKLQLPKSTRDILSVFNLSRTNQILRGRSPTFQIQVKKIETFVSMKFSQLISRDKKIIIFLMALGFIQYLIFATTAS